MKTNSFFLVIIFSLLVITFNLSAQNNFLFLYSDDQQSEISEATQQILQKIFSYHAEAGIDSLILELMESYQIPGVSSCIVNEDQIVWEGYYGYANLEQKIEVSESTLFRLASISKLITATAIMQLWEDDKFDLDDDINQYLPENMQIVNPNFPDEIITFKMLLTHTSSINNYWNILNGLRVVGDSPISLENFILNYFIPGGSYYSEINNFHNWIPGTQFDYANVGFALLGYLVEVISDTSFPEICKKQIFNPLRMDNSGWKLADVDNEILATPYASQYTPMDQYGDPWYPAGGLKTSATELANFLIAYMQRGHFSDSSILDSNTVKMMTTPYNQGNFETEFRGLGWVIDDLDVFFGGTLGKRYLGHDGNSPGFKTAMWYKPENNRGVITLTNCESVWGMYYVWYLLNRFSDYYDKIYAFNTGLNSKLNSTYLRPDIDTLYMQTKFVNGDDQEFKSNFIYTSLDSSIIDSIALYDDGNHNDGQANDGIWGNKIDPVLTENDFNVSISTTDLVSGEYYKSEDCAAFTSIGKVVSDSYTITNPFGTFYNIKLSLKNEGLVATANNVTVELTTLDTINITNIVQAVQSGIDMDAGETIEIDKPFGIYTTGSFDIHSLTVKIFSNGYHFWTDTLGIEDGLYDETQLTPRSFSLSQNYPNPFNPSTTIDFTLPKSEFVTLKIYNILGEEIATLVQDKLQAGNHTYQFDGSNLASGVYLYRIEAGKYYQMKKMILIK